MLPKGRNKPFRDGDRDKGKIRDGGYWEVFDGEGTAEKADPRVEEMKGMEAEGGGAGVRAGAGLVERGAELVEFRAWRHWRCDAMEA